MFIEWEERFADHRKSGLWSSELGCISMFLVCKTLNEVQANYWLKEVCGLQAAVAVVYREINS